MRDFLKICGCFGALFLLARLDDSTSGRKNFIDLNHTNFQKYHDNTVTLHRYLFEIYNLSARAKKEEAENRFEEVVQLWYARDVLVIPLQRQNLPFKYFPSDSLVKLQKLLNLTNEQNSMKHFFSIAQEIKRIQARMDEFDIPSQTARRDH